MTDLEGSRVAALLVRLDAVEERLRRAASLEVGGAVTAPDPTSGERWDAGQVWAHIAEAVPYWHGQLGLVLDRDRAEPVPFGRVATDPTRIATIEAKRREAVDAQLGRLIGSLAALRRQLRALPTPAWQRRGLHPTRGKMDVVEIVERFVVNHLEEHAEQLASLAPSPPP